MSKKRLPDDIPMPEDWTPEQDRDAQWGTMAQLMRESRETPGPHPADMRVVRDAVRAELEEEGRLLPPRARFAPPRDSFGEWLRQVVMGGGLGAQTVRLAAVAAIVFAVTRPSPTNEVMTAGAPITQEVPTEIAAERPVAPRTAPTEVAVATVADQPVIERTAMPPSTGVGGESVTRSGVTSDGRLRDVMEVSRDLGLTTEPQSWYVASHFSHPGDYMATVDPGGEGLELLHQLRFHLMNRAPDPVGLRTVQELEDALIPLLVANASSPASRVDTLDVMREADEAMAAGRMEDARRHYEMLIRLDPGSFLAFTAQFQVAHLDFDELQDYEAALRSYRAALEDYPARYLTDEQRETVRARLEMLSANYQHNWAPLRLWQRAQKSVAVPERAEALRTLVTDYAQAPLAGEAAVSLARLFSESRFGENESPESLADMFLDAIDRAPGAKHTASLQYARAETLFFTTTDRSSVAEEYRRVLTMPGHEPWAANVNLRLRQLTRGAR